MSSTSILVSTFAPFGTLSLSVPSSTPVHALPSFLQAHAPRLPMDQLSLSHASRILSPSTPISSYTSNGAPVSLRLAPAMLGGKGGFGSQLRAAGGRMSSRRTNNTDSCRDLNGRRLGTVKEAERLADYLAGEDERKKEQAEAKKRKLAQLEKQLGIDNKNTQENADKEEGSSTAKGPATGQKRRFDDTKFLEETQEIVEGVRDAVAAGLLKKRKKAKADASPKDAEPSAAQAAATAVMSSSATAPVAAVASLAVGIAAA
jgi:hypothetical protein